MNQTEFEAALRTAKNEHDRIAWFGALLALESGLGSRVAVVGGSAIEVYLTSDKYTSSDIDVVGDKSAIIPVLRRWGFEQRIGRDQRVYWASESLGLVDLVGSKDKAGLAPRPYPTPYGEAFLGSIEALILRRLVRAPREESRELFEQAEALAVAFGDTLDWDYLTAEARYEKVDSLLEELRKRASSAR